MIIERMAPSFISEIDHCTSTPCLNNGTCSSRNGTFDCTCSKGWTGRMCEQGINSIYAHQGHAYQTLYMYYSSNRMTRILLCAYLQMLMSVWSVHALAAARV